MAQTRCRLVLGCDQKTEDMETSRHGNHSGNGYGSEEGVVLPGPGTDSILSRTLGYRCKERREAPPGVDPGRMDRGHGMVGCVVKGVERHLGPQPESVDVSMSGGMERSTKKKISSFWPRRKTGRRR